ncbi:MAG: 4-hydroxy-tetrahydrodipicolinate reductase [Burkholderiales bacterium]|nr:MAG: 4-hydroxy-tetrahydrodipicolinate reductase [Betaproteobacteria bacterium TMED22]|tara:strand:- start:3765 stop:4568 length:804 start_codon:yes stop_codon:yes gene_type:complete
MDKLKIAVCGASGKMGRALIGCIRDDDALALVGALEVPGNSCLGKDAGGLLGFDSGVVISSDIDAVTSSADVLIDFTRPEGTIDHMSVCMSNNTAMVIGTTGFTSAQKESISTASATIPLVMAPNMSLGVNVLLRLLKIASTALGDEYDVEIVEAHHKHKVDAPSGTALRMGEVIAESLGRDLSDCAVYAREGHTGSRKSKTIGFSTVRAGDIIGEHTAVFAGTGERIEIIHKASDRSNFAVGALRAAKFLSGKKDGLFDMQDVLDG